jgi:hypothetical protein
VAALAVGRVQRDGSVAAPTAPDPAIALLAVPGALVLRSTGSLQVGTGTPVSAGANLLLASTGADADLVLGSDVSSGAGQLTLTAGHDLRVGAAVRLVAAAAGKTLDLSAGHDLILAADSTLSTNNGAQMLAAGGSITVSTLGAGAAAVALTATAGSVWDASAAGDTAVNVTAGALRLTAGQAIGSAGNALELAVGTLSLAAGSAAWVSNAGALQIDSVSATVNRVAADGSSSALGSGAQEDVIVSGSGALALSVLSGDLTLSGGTASPATAVSAGGGPVLLSAVAGRLQINAGLGSGGPVSLLAGGDLNLGAAVTITGGGSLDVQATGALTMSAGASLHGGSGDMRIVAGSVMSLGGVATGGRVSLNARSIVESGNADIDVAAAALQVITSGSGTTQGFGSGTSPMRLQVSTLAARVAGTGAGGLFASNSGDLAIDTVAAIGVDRVAADGTLSRGASTDAALSDLVSGGNAVLVVGGSATLRDGQAADGGLRAGANVRVSSGGDLRLDAALFSSAGYVSLAAGAQLLQNADIAISRSGRSIDLQAGGALTMSPGTADTTVNSAIRLQAGADLSLSRLAAGQGNVSLISSSGSILQAAGDSAAGVAAGGLRLAAAVGVGSAATPFSTAVDTVSARAGAGGIWIREADAVTVGDVAVSVRRVGPLATTTEVADAVQSDLVTTSGNGGINLSTINGNISFSDGTAPQDGRSVTADGSGRVVLVAGGAQSVLDLPGGQIAQQGPVTVGSGLRINGNLQIDAGVGGARGEGSIDLQGAIDGTPGGAGDSLVLNSDGASVHVGGVVGGIEAPSGLVINDASDITFDQAVNVAGDVTIQASGIVRFDGPLQLSSGSLSIRGASQVLIGDLTLATGNVVLTVDALSLSGTVKGSAGASWNLQSATATHTFWIGSGGSDPGLRLNSAALQALQGFGSVVLGASGGSPVDLDVATLAALAAPAVTVAGTRIAIHGSASAALSSELTLGLHADQALSLDGGLKLSRGGADLVASAGTTLRMAAGSAATTPGGDLALLAAGDLVVGTLDTRMAGAPSGTVLLSSSGGIITDAGVDASTDVFARLLTLRGRGPTLLPGTLETAAAVDVAAAQVDVDAPLGLVVRDTGSDGRVRINLIDGGLLLQEMVAEGPTARQASTAQAGNAAAAGAAGLAAWLAAMDLQRALNAPWSRPALSAGTDTVWDGSAGPSATAAAYLTHTVQGTTVAEALEGGLARRLEQAWVLGTTSSQILASGAAAAGTMAYELWDDSLRL